MRATFLGMWSLPLLLAASLSAHFDQQHLVERVIDGDTVVVSGIGTVRMIGVDTPETVDPRKPVQNFGKQASAFAARLLLRQPVRLEYDHQRTDKYHRTLAYLFLADGTLANLEIIRQGYGKAYLSYPFSRMEAFRAAEREAREAKRGLWVHGVDTDAQQHRATPAASIRVWVNTSAGVYHCPGTRFYGATKAGVFLSEEQAIREGSRAANGRQCQ